MIVAGLVIGAGCTSTSTTVERTPSDVATAIAERRATVISLDRFIEIIGRTPEITRAAGRYEEALWIDRTWAVQAIVGPSAEVQGYSVTTRDPQFRPLVEPLGGTPLGATPLDECSGFNPADLGMGLGATTRGTSVLHRGLDPERCDR